MNLPSLADGRAIVACSSGSLQNTAIALIRISGFNDFRDVAHFFRNSATGSIGPLPVPEARKATFCLLVEGERVLDQIVLTYFEAPNSFTGEHLLELGVHGNQVNVQRILDLLISSGPCRLAIPGEFAYRALKNDKISLAEAEGLDLFLNAPSKGVLEQAAKLMGGELSRIYLDLRESFLKLRASVELSLDFLEDVGRERAQENFIFCIQDFAKKLEALHRRIRAPLSAITSPNIVLVGRPNTGKSSLFNRFLQESRSIISPEEGTTRDYISEYVSFQNIQFRLVDTAGVRETMQEVEREGIARSLHLIREAFFKILLIDPYTLDPRELAPFLDIHFDLVLFTFGDRGQTQKIEIPVGYNYYGYVSLQSGPIGPGEIELRSGPIEPLSMTIQPQKLTAIESIVVESYLKLLEGDEILIPRQRVLIDECFSLFKDFQRQMSAEKDMAIVASELNIIGQKIEALLGLTPVDEVLDGVFSRFCIGK